MKKLIGLAMVVLAIIGGVKVVKNLSGDDTSRSTGNAAYDSGRKAGKYTAPVVIVVIGLIGLWMLLQSGDMRPAAPPRRNPSGNLPPPGDPSLRGGQNTFASNPARLQLNTGAWLAANPQVIILTSCVALAGLIVLFIKVVPGIVLIATAGIMLQKAIKKAIKEAKHKFFKGDVCPGMVLYAQDNLVAVFTDLKAGGDMPCPAVKIFKQPLNRMTTEPAFDGMRVAAAALYFGNVRQAAWQNFSPEVINCVVHDPEEIARVLGSIQEHEWQSLDNCLAQIPVAKPGLYRMWEVDSSAPVETNFGPAKPWFKTMPAVIGLSILGAFVALIAGLQILAAVSRSMNHRNVTSQFPNPAPPAAAMNSPQPGEPAKAGSFAVGGKVEANWAGGWIPGKITEINPGGFTMMVQLEDSRWPHPIVLSTNQLRAK